MLFHADFFNKINNHLSYWDIFIVLWSNCHNHVVFDFCKWLQSNQAVVRINKNQATCSNYSTSLRYLRFDDDDRKLRFHDIFTKNDNYLDRIIAGCFEKHLHFLTTTDCYSEASKLERLQSRFWVLLYFIFQVFYIIF